MIEDRLALAREIERILIAELRGQGCSVFNESGTWLFLADRERVSISRIAEQLSLALAP